MRRERESWGKEKEREKERGREKKCGEKHSAVREDEVHMQRNVKEMESLGSIDPPQFQLDFITLLTWITPSQGKGHEFLISSEGAI